MQSSIELHQDEQVLAVIRQSIVCELGRFILAIFFLLTPFFFFFPLLKLGGFGFVLFIIIESFAILYFGRLGIAWYYTLLIITDQRIIDTDQQGLFKREISELDIRNIKSCVTIKPSLFERFFRIRTIILKTKKEKEFNIRFECIRDVNKVKELLSEVLDKYGK
ncbi:MAG: PH domain-containing protein [Patescibacteria group bacterium]